MSRLPWNFAAAKCRVAAVLSKFLKKKKRENWKLRSVYPTKFAKKKNCLQRQRMKNKQMAERSTRRGCE